jgi:hypothetical protein
MAERSVPKVTLRGFGLLSEGVRAQHMMCLDCQASPRVEHRLRFIERSGDAVGNGAGDAPKLEGFLIIG